MLVEVTDRFAKLATPICVYVTPSGLRYGRKRLPLIGTEADGARLVERLASHGLTAHLIMEDDC